MDTGLVVYIPITDQWGGVVSAPCEIVHETLCLTRWNTELGMFITKNLKLDSGHHADRGLEYAQLIANFFGGKVVDTRPPNEATSGGGRGW